MTNKTNKQLFAAIDRNLSTTRQLASLSVRLFNDKANGPEAAALAADRDLAKLVANVAKTHRAYMEFEENYDGDAGSLEELYDRGFDALWAFCKVFASRSTAAGIWANPDALLVAIERRWADEEADLLDWLNQR